MPSGWDTDKLCAWIDENYKNSQDLQTVIRDFKLEGDIFTEYDA